MAKAKAKAKPQAQRPSDRPEPWPAWLWLLIGAVAGAGLSAVVLLRDWLPLKHSGPTPNPAATAPKPTEPAAADHAPPKPLETKPKYDFYTVLPEMESVVPESELKAKPPAPTPPPAPNGSATAPPAGTPAAPNDPAAAGRFFLQTGSFKDTPSAEQQKAKLALLGLRAQVVDISINGVTWHRVRVGPYAAASDLDGAKRSLEANGMSGIPLKENAP